MNPLDAIPTHPGAVVVGGGIAGAVSAWELARAGVRPLLIEARGYLGGLIARGTVGGVDVDLGAETYVLRGTDTSSIVDALGLTSVEPAGSAPACTPPPCTAAGSCASSCATRSWASPPTRTRPTASACSARMGCAAP